MSSLKGAPSLNRPPQKGFSYDAFDDFEDEDDDYIPPVSNELEEKKKKKKEKKEKRKEKERKREKAKKKEGQHTSDSGGGMSKHYSGDTTSQASPRTDNSKRKDDDDDDDYDYDFDEDIEDNNAIQYSDDFEDDVIPEVPSVPSANVVKDQQRLKEEQERLDRIAEEKLRAEREKHEEQIRRWQAEQERSEKEMQRQQEQLRLQMEELKRAQEEKMKEMEAAAAAAAAKAAATAATTTKGMKSGDDHANMAGSLVGEDPEEGQRGALSGAQRRRLREREHALHLRRLEQEEAARGLFQRLAQDVRDVFHELNLSVVAAEKERLLRDERYRRGREERDRREEAERAERLEKEARERETREAQFWTAMDERERRWQAAVEARAAKDDEEREGRWRREREDREARQRADAEARAETERHERERRLRDDTHERERDRAVQQAQLEDARRQYEAQLEEARRQFEFDRAHAAEMHRMEMEAIEKRHAESLGQNDRVHMQQIALLETHTGNASKLEKLIAQMHEDMEATKKMNVTLTEERLALLRQKEHLIDEQKALVDSVLEELKYTKEELEKERARVASLYAKFDISLSNFTKEAAEERRRSQESQAHYETLRQQLEKDRKMMLFEIAQERKVFEQQYEDFMGKKLQAMAELQEERMSIARERTEAAMLRERRNNDEADVLKSLRAHEEAYAAKVEGIEEDRIAISNMKIEQKRMCDEITKEREALRREREAFEAEKGDLLRRFEEVQLRAVEASAAQERIRHELELQNAEKAKIRAETAARRVQVHTDPVAVAGVASRLQIDLSRQRAILKRLGHT
ncbi:trichohyalin [Trypanosoma theileri]|uniref:Trichohyalin n=1 Tax=Trypanosoma theileri TaxID=67003 RepID=A0A1X0P1G0_9TRYP|nr:trichohyalin [Trypanosoma theileri]ORC90786.1 trichohyalin [Trypanosoma theileri]